VVHPYQQASDGALSLAKSMLASSTQAKWPQLA
jgi:hypothetical protein